MWCSEYVIRNFFCLSLRDSRLSRRGCRPTPTLNFVTTPACVCVQGQILCSVSAFGYGECSITPLYSMISSLNNVLDSEDVSEQRVSASLPDSVPIESEEERAAREADEMAALDAVGDYEADPNVMLEDVPQDIVIKTLKVSCACVPVLVFVCVCVRVRVRDVDMCS
jgi:hypothetical protein